MPTLYKTGNGIRPSAKDTEIAAGLIDAGICST
jgi:hypothetical protein